VLTWNEKDIRPTMYDIQYLIMDFRVGKLVWMTMDDIIKIVDADGSRVSKAFRDFRLRAENREKEVKEIINNHVFEKKILRSYSNDRTTVAEIVQYDYGNGIVSAPRLMKSLAFNDFYYKNPSWGIEDELIIESNKLGVEDVYLIDEYNNWHFHTTMKKLKLLGEEMSWGKTYMPLKHLKVFKYGDRVPNYEKFLKGVEIHENNRTD